MSPTADLARQLSPEIIRLRRDFHAHPELSFHESRTSDVVAGYLAELGLEVVRPDGMTGLWADLRVEDAARTLLFRADMDALAMQEGPGPNKGAFLSTRDGAAHCCGHDAHMAMLLAAARALALGEAERRVNLRFLFQHAEERPPGGAIQLIEAGCLEGVDEVYGLHVIPPIPSGLFDVMAGPFMAAADNFTVDVVGRGGHAAMPHLVRDPIAASAQVLSALQQLVSRDASPFEALVLTVSSIRGGSDTHNVVADRCTLKGT
ncbi:MAG: amidohydrolase, partial [Planctomycetota bacterium]